MCRLGKFDILNNMANLISGDLLKKQLMKVQKSLIRLYVIEAFDLSCRDVGSASDPYLKIQLDDKIYNERDNYQMDETNP